MLKQLRFSHRLTWVNWDTRSAWNGHLRGLLFEILLLLICNVISDSHVLSQYSALVDI